MNVPQALNTAWSQIKSFDLEQARKTLEGAVPYAFENPEILGGLKGISFWKERELSFQGLSEPLVQSDYYFAQWITFLEFSQRNAIKDDACLFAFKSFVFGSLKEVLYKGLDAEDAVDPWRFMRIGLCEKLLGNYESALSMFESAASGLPEQPELLAHMADVYALLEEAPRAKVLFREAFFINAQEVELEFLESEMIKRLIEHVRNRHMEPKLVREWIPVYGAILGILSIKRELRAVEFGRLKQSIYALEREYAHQAEKRDLLEPRLINRYFWQIDHLVSLDEEPEKIDEVLLKIKGLNPDIHKLYTR